MCDDVRAASGDVAAFAKGVDGYDIRARQQLAVYEPEIAVHPSQQARSRFCSSNRTPGRQSLETLCQNPLQTTMERLSEGAEPIFL